MIRAAIMSQFKVRIKKSRISCLDIAVSMMRATAVAGVKHCLAPATVLLCHSDPHFASKLLKYISCTLDIAQLCLITQHEMFFR